MSDHHELAALIMFGGITTGPEVGLDVACARVADAIIRAGYRKPKEDEVGTVRELVEELQALRAKVEAVRGVLLDAEQCGEDVDVDDIRAAIEGGSGV